VAKQSLSAGGATSTSASPFSSGARDPPRQRGEEKWHQQSSTWLETAKKFGIAPDRYGEFRYLQFIDLENVFSTNYLKFQLGISQPLFLKIGYHLMQNFGRR
jgi:hypothetical protein